MTQALYRGYSSIGITGTDTALQDLALIKQDLLNHFMTRIGERVARPTFGSIIHDLLFNLSDPRVEGLIVQDAQRILDLEPRVELLEMVPKISIDAHSVELAIRVRAIEIDIEDWFTVTFGYGR